MEEAVVHPSIRSWDHGSSGLGGSSGGRPSLRIRQRQRVAVDVVVGEWMEDDDDVSSAVVGEPWMKWRRRVNHVVAVVWVVMMNLPTAAAVVDSAASCGDD